MRLILALTCFYPDFCYLVKIEKGVFIDPDYYYSYHYKLLDEAFYDVYGFHIKDCASKFRSYAVSLEDFER